MKKPSGPVPTQRKRASSRTMQNYHPVRQESEEPQLDSIVYIVELSPLNQSFEKRILKVPKYPECLRLGRQNGPRNLRLSEGLFDSRVLSRNHAELFINDTNLYIRDLKSANGTFVNGNKLEPHKPYELKIGDHLELGTTIDQQSAHKKISALVEGFNVMVLSEYNHLIYNGSAGHGCLKNECFNSGIDSLIFGGFSADQEQDILAKLINNENDDDCDIKNFSLEASACSPLEEIVHKLRVSISNESIQHEKLMAVSKFLAQYNEMLDSNRPQHKVQLVEESTQRYTDEIMELKAENDKLRQRVHSPDSSDEDLLIRLDQRNPIQHNLPVKSYASTNWKLAYIVILALFIALITIKSQQSESYILIGGYLRHVRYYFCIFEDFLNRVILGTKNMATSQQIGHAP